MTAGQLGFGRGFVQRAAWNFPTPEPPVRADRKAEKWRTSGDTTQWEMVRKMLEDRNPTHRPSTLSSPQLKQQSGGCLPPAWGNFREPGGAAGAGGFAPGFGYRRASLRSIAA